jgi:hypothetical protein
MKALCFRFEKGYPGGVEAKWVRLVVWAGTAQTANPDTRRKRQTRNPNDKKKTRGAGKDQGR